MSRSVAALAIAALSLASSPAAWAQSAPLSAQSPAPSLAADYSVASNWLCRPGRQDACAADISSTIVAANGKLTQARFTRAASPRVDCFYVYPTVSLDQGPISDMVPGAQEKAVIANQFARFGEVCRTFAPMYRQVTLTALRSGMAGTPMAGIDREIGYADVRAAWNHYLAHDNKGRGVILIGHSQGSGVLKRLIAEQIDGKPDQAKLVGAYLLGTNILTPRGIPVGGDFKSVPICTAAGQTGCVVSFVSFRSTIPPPAQTRFARTDKPGMEVACVNPAAIGSDRAAPLKAFLGNRPISAYSQQPITPWVANGTVTTPFVQVPGLLTGACTTVDAARYLKVQVNPDPRDPRTDEISGDVVVNGKVAGDWGLHVIDVNIAMGNLLDVARAQSAAFVVKR